MNIKLTNFIPISKKDIDILEKSLKYRLPDEYTKFLLSFNGTKPEANIFSIDRNNDSGIDKFIPCEDIMKELPNIENSYKNNMIPVAWAEGGNYVLLNLKNGIVYFWDHENPYKLRKIASGIFSFLEDLKPFDIEKIQLDESKIKSAWIDPDFFKEQQNKGNT